MNDGVLSEAPTLMSCTTEHVCAEAVDPARPIARVTGARMVLALIVQLPFRVTDVERSLDLGPDSTTSTGFRGAARRANRATPVDSVRRPRVFY